MPGGQRKLPRVSFEFSPDVQNHEVEVPPDKEFILHIVADGFREWSPEKMTLVPSGNQMTLGVELEPLRSGNTEGQKEVSSKEWARWLKNIDCLTDGNNWLCAEF